MAAQYPAKKNTAYTLYFTLYKADGTVIANPGTITKKISKDGGAFADIDASVTEIDTTYGLCSLVLSATEMNADAVSLYIKDDTSGCVPLTATILTASATFTELKTETASILEDTAVIGAAGAGLTAVPWNASWDAEVQSECTDALNAYDPPTNTEMAAGLAAIPAAIWDYLTSALTTAGSIGKALYDWLVSIPAGATAFGESDLEVCNNALMLLGNEAVANLTDTTKKAVRLCSQFYSQTKSEVLRAYNWNCATVRDTLTVDATAPDHGEFDYRFAVPADCLRVLKISDDQTIKFKVENGYILTNDTSGEVAYIKEINVSDMDALLISALSARLAAKIAFPLTNSVSVADAMYKLYKDILDEAQTMDAFEGSSDSFGNDNLINTRL